MEKHMYRLLYLIRYYLVMDEEDRAAADEADAHYESIKRYAPYVELGGVQLLFTDNRPFIMGDEE